MSINPEIKREVLNKLRMAQADLEAIEEEHAGTYDLQPTIETLRDVIAKLESSALTSRLQHRDVRRRAMDEHIDVVREALARSHPQRR